MGIRSLMGLRGARDKPRTGAVTAPGDTNDSKRTNKNREWSSGDGDHQRVN